MRTNKPWPVIQRTDAPSNQLAFAAERINAMAALAKSQGQNILLQRQAPHPMIFLRAECSSDGGILIAYVDGESRRETSIGTVDLQRVLLWRQGPLVCLDDDGHPFILTFGKVVQQPMAKMYAVPMPSVREDAISAGQSAAKTDAKRVPNGAEPSSGADGCQSEAKTKAKRRPL